MSTREKQLIINFLKDINIILENPKDYKEDVTYYRGKNTFSINYGSSRIVILLNNKIAIKIEKDGISCEREVEIYNKAKERNLQFFFAKEEYFGECNGYKIYVQEFAQVNVNRCVADMRDYYIHNGMQKDAYSLATGHDYLPLKDILLGIFDAEEEFNNIYSFILENNINDIHYFNIGFIDDLPVFIDYAGI